MGLPGLLAEGGECFRSKRSEGSFFLAQCKTLQRRVICGLNPNPGLPGRVVEYEANRIASIHARKILGCASCLCKSPQNVCSVQYPDRV